MGKQNFCYKENLTKCLRFSSESFLFFQFRYSYDWKAATEVGVVNPPNANGVVTISNLVIDQPTVKPMFSPAVSIQLYPGKRSFSYSPTLYYDFTGKAGTSDPFGNLN